MTTSNGFAGRDDFFGDGKRRFKTVSLPGGKQCRIRSLTAGEWCDLDAKNVDIKRGGLSAVGLRNSDLRLVIAAVCDGDGNLVFQESDLSSLAAVDASLVIPLVKEIRDHCGLKSTTDDALKNSEATAG